MDVQSPLFERGPARSRDADRVDFRELFAAIWRRRKLVAGAGLILGSLLYLFSAIQPPTYTAYAKVMLDGRNVQILPSEEVVGHLDLSDPVILSEMSVMESNVLLSTLIDQIGLDLLAEHYFGDEDIGDTRETRMATVIWAVRENLTIRREGESYVLEIQFDSGEPKLAQAIANGVADTYIELQIADRRDSVRKATTWIQEQVAEARDDVERAEAAVAQYRTESLARDGSSAETATQQLGNITAQLAIARSERVAAEAEYQQLQEILATQGPAGLAKSVTSPLLESLSAERATLMRDDSEWARSFDATHPQRVRLANAIASLDAELEAEGQRVIELFANKLEVAGLREKSLQQAVSELEDQVANISENNLGLRQREREAQAARANYEALLTRLSATSGQESLQRAEARIIERAPLPNVRTAPRPKLMAAFGLIFGLTGGVVAALMLEMTRSTFRKASEVEAETGVRVLATLPELSSTHVSDIIDELDHEKHPGYAERLRQLRTKIFMANGGFERQVVMVTSSLPEEGKSLTSMGLATSAVQSGKTVLLIDADLRRSRLAKAFGWRPEYDLVDYMNRRCNLAEAIHTDGYLGLDVLGVAQPGQLDETEFDTKWLEPTLAELKRVYDVIIIDAPPLLAVADGLILARVADAIVHVVRWDKTPREVVEDGLTALSEVRGKVFGIVLNRAGKGHKGEYGGEYGGDTYA